MSKKELIIRKNISTTLYLIIAIISLILGSLYLFRNEFMGYHAAALQQSWPQLDLNLQVLIKALMIVAGAGWISLGIAILFILLGAFRTNIKWSGFAIPILILVFYVPTLIATLTVLNNTPSTPPWYGNAIACCIAVLSFLIYNPSTMKKSITYE